MSEDETTTEQLAEIDRDLVEIETLVSELAREALRANYPQQVETTTDMLTEIEGQAQPEQVNDWPSVRQLRHELKTVQTQLGESRQRVTQLEELVSSLRTINAAQEKSVRLAGQENTDLKHRLDVVSKEWADQAATCNGLRAQLDRRDAQIRDLQIELDALQQAPQAETMAATPPATEDRFEQGWDAGTARAVETIAEWTEPFRRCGSQALALAVMANLPHIMRTLTGLIPED